MWSHDLGWHSWNLTKCFSLYLMLQNISKSFIFSCILSLLSVTGQILCNHMSASCMFLWHHTHWPPSSCCHTSVYSECACLTSWCTLLPAYLKNYCSVIQKSCKTLFVWYTLYIHIHVFIINYWPWRMLSKLKWPLLGKGSPLLI